MESGTTGTFLLNGPYMRSNQTIYSGSYDYVDLAWLDAFLWETIFSKLNLVT